MGDKIMYAVTPIATSGQLIQASHRPETEEIRQALRQQVSGRWIAFLLLMSALVMAFVLVLVTIQKDIDLSKAIVGCFTTAVVVFIVVGGYILYNFYDLSFTELCMDTLKKIHKGPANKEKDPDEKQEGKIKEEKEVNDKNIFKIENNLNNKKEK